MGFPSPICFQNWDLLRCERICRRRRRFTLTASLYIEAAGRRRKGMCRLRMEAAVKGETSSSVVEHVPLPGFLADQPHRSRALPSDSSSNSSSNHSATASSSNSSSSGVSSSSSCSDSRDDSDTWGGCCSTEAAAGASPSGQLESWQQQQSSGSSATPQGSFSSSSGEEVEGGAARPEASPDQELQQQRQQPLQQVALAKQVAVLAEGEVAATTPAAVTAERKAEAATAEVRGEAAAAGGETLATAAEATPAATPFTATAAAGGAGGYAAAGDVAAAGEATAARDAGGGAAAAPTGAAAEGQAAATAAQVAEGEQEGVGTGAAAGAAAGIAVGRMLTYAAAPDTDPSRVAAAAMAAGAAAAAAEQQQQQPQDAFGTSTTRAAASRKRKADAYLPDGDAETMDRLKKKLESLTKEQMKILLAKACVQYPAVEMALNSIIEADPASRRLMIRNVAFTTTEQALREKLEAFGEIEDFKLVVERTSGQNKGFAFVTYRAMESVQHILNEQVVVDGRHLQVKLASQQDPINAFKRSFPGVVPSCRLFVRNVPDTCDDERLREEFSVFGEIREAVIIRSKEGKSKGYGFVVFEEPEALMKATCQSQRVIDGQVTFVSVASETPRRNGQQLQQQAQLRGSPNAAAVPGAAGWPLGTTPLAATANPYVQQMAALSPSLYMQQYQQHFMTASQVNAAVAAVTAQQQHPNVGAAAVQALQQHAQHGTLR